MKFIINKYKSFTTTEILKFIHMFYYTKEVDHVIKSSSYYRTIVSLLIFTVLQT